MPTAGETLTKHISDDIDYVMDFHRVLADADTIQTVQSVTVDPVGPPLGSRSVDPTGMLVLQRFLAGGSAGTYTVTFRVVTVTGETLNEKGVLEVIAD